MWEEVSGSELESYCVIVTESIWESISDGKKLFAMQETLVSFLCQEYPMQKEMATHSSILAWKIP